jgi:DNA-nicking Smr family endonuclease
MRRGLRPEEASLWTVVTSTVRPMLGRKPPASPKPPLDPSPSVAAPLPKPVAASSAPPRRLKPAPAAAPEAQVIEPGRRRRIARGRDDIAARLDLHGLDQDRARLALIGFLQRAHADGARTVLVITGKGVAGQGVLRRRVPEWLADPALRAVVAGLSSAEQHHGGEGALYIALKRRRL